MTFCFGVSHTSFTQNIHWNRWTHWGRVTHICINNLTIIGSDNGLSPSRRQAIISTNAGILLIGPLGTNFSDILIEIPTFSFNKMHLRMLSAKWRPFCLGLNVLMVNITIHVHVSAVVTMDNRLMYRLWSHSQMKYNHFGHPSIHARSCETVYYIYIYVYVYIYIYQLETHLTFKMCCWSSPL